MTPSSLSSIVVFLCAFICCISHASALSNPSPRVNGYNNFPGTSTTVAAATAPRKLKASNLNKQPRQQQKSYVPDGLTEEQYRKIKNEELAKQQSMNFGMWGPRFKQTDGDPEFWNWFSSPTLWTGGFASNNGRNIGGASGNNNGNGDRTIANLLVLYLRRYALAYLMMLLSTQMLVKSLLPKKVWSAKWVAAVRILLPIVTLKPLNMVASFAERREIRWLRTNGTTKFATVLAVFISAVSFALR